MPIRFTMDDAVTRGAEYLLSRQHISQERKNEIMPATKYNLLVKGFNVSTVLLVIAAASAVFLALTSSFVFLAMGLFVRYTTLKEIEKYTMPIEEADHLNHLRHALNRTSDGENVTNLFRKIGMHQPDGWEENEMIFLDFVAWKNPIEIVERVERVSGPILPD